MFLTEEEIFLSEAQKLRECESIKQANGVLSQVAYELNQYLTIESLRLVDTRHLKALFIKVCLRHIKGNKDTKEAEDILGKAGRLQNRPIGGDWF